MLGQDGNQGLILKLRQGVKFQDDEPFDAGAVKFSIERHLNMPGSNRKAEISAVSVVEIIDASQVPIKLYVNRVSLRPVRVTYQVLNPQSQEQDEYADDYSDYQVIQGIATPMHIGRFVNDERVAEIFRSSARYDENYPASYFSQPSGQSVSE